MRRAIGTVPNALMLGALVLVPGGVAAGEGQPVASRTAAVAANEPAQPAVGEDKLNRFIEATQEIGALRHAYAPKLRAANTLERRLIRAQARNRIAGVLRDKGLSHAEYRAIGRLMENDPGIDERLLRASS